MRLGSIFFHSIIAEGKKEFLFGFEKRNFIRISKSIMRVSCSNYIRRRLIFVDLVKETKLFVPSADLK